MIMSDRVAAATTPRIGVTRVHVQGTVAVGSMALPCLWFALPHTIDIAKICALLAPLARCPVVVQGGRARVSPTKREGSHPRNSLSADWLRKFAPSARVLSAPTKEKEDEEEHMQKCVWFPSRLPWNACTIAGEMHGHSPRRLAAELHL